MSCCKKNLKLESPDFIVIGGMKCGSTSLYENLLSNPDIGLCLQKEIAYFCTRYANSYEWYLNQFPREGKVKGEVSANYTKLHLYPEVPKRMWEHCPGVKLIYIVRNPIDRFLSHYVHNVAMEQELRTFEQILKELHDNGDYIYIGQYIKHIEEYLKYFSKDQLKIVLLDDLKKNGQQTMEDIYSFIGVAANNSNEFTKCRNTGQAQTQHRAYVKLLCKIPGLRKIAKYIVPVKFKEKFCRQSIERPVLNNDNFEFVKRFFYKEIRSLEEYLDRDLSHWLENK